MEDDRKLSKEEFDTFANFELHRLQGDLRRTLNDHEACKKRGYVALTNQKKILKLLESDKEELLEKVNLKGKKCLKQNKISITEEIGKLMDKYEECVKEISIKTLQLSELQAEIKTVNMNINKYSTNQSIRAADSNKNSAENKLLETFLKTESTLFDQITTENRNLQFEVNNLLQQRLNFNNLYKQSIKGLLEGKDAMYDLLKICSDAYEDRQKICFRLDTLKTEAKKSYMRNYQEFFSLDQDLRHQENQNIFLEAKQKIRDTAELEDEIQRDAKTLRKTLEQKLNFYNSIVADLNEKYKVNDLDQIIPSFLKIEEENFNTFSFLNEQNKRINGIIEEVRQVEKEIIDQQAANEKHKKERVKDYKKGEIRLKVLKEKLLREKMYLTQLESVLEESLEGVKSVFNILSCDWAPMKRVLGISDNVTKFNVHLFLRAIDERLSLINTSVRFKVDKLRKSRTIYFHSTQLFNFGQSEGRFKYSIETPCPFCVECQDGGDGITIKPLEMNEIVHLVMEDKRRQRWRPVMHNASECPQPVARKTPQKKMVTV